MSDVPAGATPGVDRTIHFSIRGHEFRLRRPSRADLAEIWRRYTAKTMRGGALLADSASIEIAQDTLNRLDGGALHMEAQLEVLLLPRPGANLGERAPSHWLRPITGPDEKVIGHLVVFDEVDPEEFDEVAKVVAAALAPKKKPATERSTDTAPAPTSD